MTKALILLLFLAPTIQYRVELGKFSFALMEPVVLLVSAILLAHQIVSQRRLVILKDPLVYLFTGMALWALIILPWAPDWQHGLSDVRDWLIPLVSFVALISSIRHHWRKWLALFILLATINASVGIYQHLAEAAGPFATELAAYKTSFLLSPEQSRLAIASPAIGFFSHPNGFAMYLFLALLIVLGWTMKGWGRWTRLFLVLLLSAALFWTYAKASLLVMPFSIAGYWFIRRIKSWGQFLVVSAGLVFSAGMIAWFISQRVPLPYLATFWWRVNLWQTALEVIRDSPGILLVGNGMEAFATQAIYPQPHSLYLYLLLAYGLPGIGLVLGMVWYLLGRGRAAHQCRLFHQEPVLSGLWIGLIGYFVIGLVESNLMGIESRMIFSMMAACFIGLRREVRTESEAVIMGREAGTDAKGPITRPVSL